ncbi:P-loop NTPase fold protein [Amphritea sp. 2_MG-2023]|uniref:KAP family P-loop NTPase fold protein n=1 Tax=Amphritea TaxID=515417 RepID=UPI001C06C081|nr:MULTISPECIES: P-loop NTPase fold protein [Amphritea]MBU2967066.1 KAP family NTPase [Amphritea atlantica]MDO6419381.1 P-loop NTPase fold protein [Amphritea sp. 2_MG-2023]
MHLKIQPPNPKATFQKEDIFQRKNFANTLTKIICSSSDPLVISLEAQWGDGKTSFIYKWCNELKEASVSVPHIYIDAYKGDFHSDAFLFLASEIYAFAKEKLVNDDELLTSLKDNIKAVGGALLKGASKTALQVLTGGMFDSKAMDNLEANISDEMSKATDLFISDSLESYQTRKDEINDLSETLTLLSNSLAGDKKPLVIIVDELDRCRPSFALELLEVIKHLFTAKSVAFVLVNNSEQMNESVKVRYGSGVNAGAYLRKFYDLSFSLPKGEAYDVTDTEIEHFALENIIHASEVELIGSNKIAFYIRLLHRHIDLSLRDIEKIAVVIAIMSKTTSFRLSEIPAVCCCIAVIFLKDRTLLQRVYYDQITRNEIDTFFKYSHLVTKDEDYDAMMELFFCFADPRHVPTGLAGDLGDKVKKSRVSIRSSVLAGLLTMQI